MYRTGIVCVLFALVLAGVSLVELVFADTPKVINPVAWNSGGDIMLNVTVYHNVVGGEIAQHYVNIVEVDVGGSLHDFPQAGPHTYYDAVNHYFNVTVGPVTGATGIPTATVKAHCLIHAWSIQNWTGQIPEYTTLALILTLLAVSTIVTYVHGKGTRIRLSR